MSGLAASLLIGAGVGLSIAAPIGPSSMLCIQRTLASGVRSGLATGLGIATVHLGYGILAVAFGTSLGPTWLGSATGAFLSAAILLWFAIRALRRPTVIALAGGKTRSLIASYYGAIGFGLVNPNTPLLFAAAVPSLTSQTGAILPSFVVLGLFTGSLAWWFVLSGSVSVFRARMTQRGLDVLNKAAGLLLAALAMTLFAHGYGLAT